MLVRLNGSFFLIYFLIELAVAYFFVDGYGFLYLLLETFATGVLGLFLIFNLGFKNLLTGLNFVNFRNFLSSFGLSLGGFFIFLPGLVSDFLGAIIVLVSLFFQSKFKDKRDNFEQFRDNQNGEIIDVEIVEDRNTLR